MKRGWYVRCPICSAEVFAGRYRWLAKIVWNHGKFLVNRCGNELVELEWVRK